MSYFANKKTLHKSVMLFQDLLPYKILGSESVKSLRSLYVRHAFITDAMMFRGSAVGIATGYGLDDRGIGVPVPVGATIFSSPSSWDRLWGPPNLLSKGYRKLFPGGKAVGTWS
jgi:hypothetical protein